MHSVTVLTRLRVYVYLTMMTFSCLFPCCCLALIYPLKLLGPGIYRDLTTRLLRFCVPSFLLTPALAGLTIRVNEEHWKMMLHSRSWAPLSIIMCNHASRIDYLLAEWCGSVDSSVRVSFLTEGTMQFLPIVGWLRKLCEDIFLWRSFSVDKKQIDANILSFKQTGTKRAIFLAIEGAIVDKGPFDFKYMDDCAAFCEQLGYKPFEYVLTPRYKGVHALAQHAGTELFCATTAFVRDGQLLNCKLADPERVVPDLFTILASPIDVTVHFDRFAIDADQEVAKRQCMDNYKYRDDMVRHFDKHGCFPGGLAYRPLPTEMFRRVSAFVVELAIAQGVCVLAGRPRALAHLLLFLFAVLGGCHWLGELVSGESRESIPFETIFKTYFYAGRDAKLVEGGKGRTAGSTLKETAKMLNLATKFPAN